MLRYRRRYWILAAGLSALAGFADAIGFVHLGGYFVSFMSGNSTRMGVELAAALPSAAVAGALIGLFVLGAMLGALLNMTGAKAGGVRVLVFVSAMLVCAAAFGAFDALAIAFLVAAMGAMNATFLRDGEVSIGITYMTGTLVRMGQRLALAITGGPKWRWAPYLLLWSGLVAGAAAGACGYALLGLQSLWLAAGVALLLTAAFARLAE